MSPTRFKKTATGESQATFAFLHLEIPGIPIAREGRLKRAQGESGENSPSKCSWHRQLLPYPATSQLVR